MGRSKTRRTMDACKKKIRHAHQPPANQHVRPYHCEYCDGWHFTSIKPKGRINWIREDRA